MTKRKLKKRELRLVLKGAMELIEKQHKAIIALCDKLPQTCNDEKEKPQSEQPPWAVD